MNAVLMTAKASGLVKPGAPFRQLASKIERARQSYNERLARAEADYVEAVKRAIASVETPEDATPEATDTPPASA